VVALSVAALFPAIHSIVGIVRHRRVDIIAVLVFAGLLVSIVLGSLTDNPKILLMRESFITGTLGVMCFVCFLKCSKTCSQHSCTCFVADRFTR
jgi:hypothetical protein